jgi:hypothetical protein
LIKWLSCGEPLVINPQWRKNKRDARQTGCSLPVLAGVKFDRDLLKEAAFGSEINFFRISDPGSPFPNPYFRELSDYQ